eukprot:TRINITY_DN2695_c0_g1_i5.p4 TRINITY_DN2695_c0_g1~~TRINITY_DN2695_c0_g1_i5.p4  ORF type:complete len:116 (-),score=56.81 TRINITY_DN2695_c0_g1_i5:252-599(-)
MPRNLLDLLRDWSDIQSLSVRLERGVNYEPTVASQVVQLATEVCKWNRCREGGREYALDPVAASILSSTGGSGSGSGSGGSGGGSGGVAGMPAGADHMEEAAHLESDSSDGEMDA